MPKLAKGICPVCEEEWAVVEKVKPNETGELKTTQTMRGHKGRILAQVDMKTWLCLGVGEPPIKITRAAD